MNYTKEKLPVFLLENEKVFLIRDLRILGIYTFLRMMMEQGEHTVCVLVDKMKEQFFIDDKELLNALTIIIEELHLISMIKEK